MPNLGDFLKAINKSKVDLMAEDSLAEKEYLPFVINRTLSYFPDTVLHANEINIRSNMDAKLQFDYLRTAIRKSNRFSRWTKPEKLEDRDVVKKTYNCNNQRASEILTLLSADQLQHLRDRQRTGGKA